MTTTTSPGEQLRTAAQKLRDTAADATPGRWQVGNGETIALNHPDGGEPLANLHDAIARLADKHRPDPGYAGMPDHRWCIECSTEECEVMPVIDAAVAVATVFHDAGAEVAR